jgi:hypothetical protein
MNNQLQTQNRGSVPTVLMIAGGVIMLLAPGCSLALYFWGQIRPSGGGEQWNDVIAGIYIVLGGLPAFLIGLILLLVGWFQKVKGKRNTAQADH